MGVFVNQPITTLLLFQRKLSATKETENCNHVDNSCGHLLCLLSSSTSFQSTHVRILSMGGKEFGLEHILVLQKYIHFKCHKHPFPFN